MPKFIYVYHGGRKPETDADREKVMSEWSAWMDKYASNFVDRGAPVGKSWTVNGSTASEGGGSNPVSGFSIVEAPTQEEALSVAKECPQTWNGGSVEVAPIMEM